MANLKMLKVPKPPKRPKSPKKNASVDAKQAWVKRYNDIKAKYASQLRTVHSENQKRKNLNQQSEKLSQQISNLGKITAQSRSFSVRRRKKSSGKKSGKRRK